MNRFGVARVLLGILFLVFGLDGLFSFLPMPPMPEPAAQVIGVLMSYRLFYVVKVLEVTAALMLLTGRYVPLALCLLAPIVFNILWFDVNLAPVGLPVGIFAAALVAALMWNERSRFSPLFAARTSELTSPR